MTVADRAVICAPIVHDIVGACKRALSGKTRSKPCAGPCIVRALPQDIGNLVGEVHRPSLGDLKHRSEVLHEIQTDHGNGHLRNGEESRRESASAEISVVGGVPRRRRKDRIDVLVGDIPPFLHRALSVLIGCDAGRVKASGTGVYKVDYTVLGNSLGSVAGCLFDRLGAPICADVGEYLRTVGEQLHEHHSETVERIVLRCENVRFACAVPIK